MSWFSSLRPHSTTWGIPGTGQTQAHASKQSSTQQTHHKLATLDPLVAQKELELKSDSKPDGKHPVSRAKALIEEMKRVEANTPAASCNRISKAIARLGRRAAKAVGLEHGKPQSHEQLLRYQNTQLNKLDKCVVPHPQDELAAHTPSTLRDLTPALVHAFECEEAYLQAQIDAEHAASVDAMLTHHIDRVKQDVGLATRRAVNLADQIPELRQQCDALAALLQKECYAIAVNSPDATQAQLSEARQALDRMRFDTHGQQLRSASAHALSALEKEIDQQSAAVTLLERALQHARLNAREAAKMLYFRGASPVREQLENKVTSANTRIDIIESELANARSELVALQQRRTRMNEFEQRLRGTEARLEQALHSSQINAEQLWGRDDEVPALKTLQSELQPVLQRKTEALDAARIACQEASEALEEQQRKLSLKLLDTMPGFHAGAGFDLAQQALRDWAGGLTQATAAFGGEALHPTEVLAIGMQALSIATGEDPAQAAQGLHELRTQSLGTLIPPPGDPAGTSAEPPTLTNAAQTTLSLLASVPRGMQVVAHMLALGNATPSKEQLEIARIYLRADNILRRTPLTDAPLRQWLGNAKTAAQRALHAASSTEGLAAATVDERAAFHAFRNGYESNAPGSPYDQANQHLQMLADWLHDASASRSRALWQRSAHNPLHALRDGLKVGAATALPTPVRRAREELEKGANHLLEYIVTRRQQLPPGQVSSKAELAMQALAEYVQRRPIETDLTKLKLDAAVLRSIEQRQRELQQHFERESLQRHATATPASPHPALDATWQALHTKVHTLPDAMSLLQRQLLLQPAQRSWQPAKDAAHWVEQEKEQRIRFHRAVGAANRLLYDGDPHRVTSGRAMYDLFRDMLEHLEWRDKLRITEQKIYGANLSPVSAAIASVLPSGIGVKLIASAQHNEDRLIEFYMGRTGLYMQIGKQGTNQFQAGAGVTGGHAWKLGHEDSSSGAGPTGKSGSTKKEGGNHLSLGVGIAADLRFKKESSIEQGVQLRIPRRTKGQELELRAQFMDMFEHLLHIATPQPDGSPSRKDWMRELLAHHPSLNTGLIENASRETFGVESNLSGSAVLRAGAVAGRARRISASTSLGFKSKAETSNTNTTVAGYMTTVYRDSTAQTKAEVSLRATAGVQVFEKIKPQSDGQKKQQAGMSAGFFDLSYAREVRAKGVTYFCTMFTFNDEIDPVRTDRAVDFQSFKDFEREIRKDWPAWVHYGTPKLPPDIDKAMRYAVAETQIEDFLERTRAFAKGNKFATMYVDRALKPKAAPMLDALRAQAKLWHLASRADLALQEELAFDNLIPTPALWEPSILMVREKTKRQAERGIDFFAKLQTNRLAESQRTVGQWILYEPVPHPEPGQKIEYVRSWTPELPEVPDEIGEIGEIEEIEEIEEPTLPHSTGSGS